MRYGFDDILNYGENNGDEVMVKENELKMKKIFITRESMWILIG
jgi:hypothetical protein